jgi:peptidoglycan/LPS O-acetylase OafA/YrhL
MGEPKEIPRIAALDGVRGLAVLVVIVHNAAWVTGESRHFLTKLFGAAAAAGWVGVQLFFVLSGFLITGILLETRDRAGYFRSFYLRRTLRIFPLYYALVAVTVFVVAPLSTDAVWASQVYERQWAYWLYVSNWVSPFGHGISGFSHLWSLAVEEQFYLVWPLMVWWLGARGLTRLAILMMLAGQSLFAVLSGCLIAWALADAGRVWAWVPRTLSSDWLRDMGQYSYAMYLLHFPIHLFLRAQIEPWVQQADDLWRLPRALAYIALVLALSYVGARITWLVIEQPWLRLKARWAPRAA